MTHRIDETLTVVDEDDNEIGKSPYREVISKKLITRSSNIFILNSEGKIFVHKRNRNLNIYPGMWDVKVGGFVSYPESYEQAAVRELREETGINLTADKLEFLFRAKFRSRVHNTNRKVYRISYDGKITVQKEEIEDSKFINLKEAKKMLKDGLFSPSAKKVLNDYLKLQTNKKSNRNLPVYYRNLFDNKLVSLYDLSIFFVTLGQEKKLRKAIANAITNNPHEILDLATGTGSVAIELKSSFPNANVIGIDLSKRMLEIAQKKSKQYNLKIKFIVKNIEKTGFANSKFDAVTISFALHELPQEYRQNVMKEAYRILRKKGIFILMDFSKPRNFLSRAFHSIFFMIAEEKHAKTILDEDLKKELADICFRDIKREILSFGYVQMIKGVK